VYSAAVPLAILNLVDLNLVSTLNLDLLYLSILNLVLLVVDLNLVYNARGKQLTWVRRIKTGIFYQPELLEPILSRR
jgi:hypothetical protein